MPAPQLTPPGHLHLHVVLVAVTPPLLALITSGTLAVLGRGRASRILGWIGIAMAWVLLALFLKPGGIAAALGAPLAGGWIVIGTWQVAAALAASAWTAWYWLPDAAVNPTWWALRVAVAMTLPLCVLPALMLACEPDLRWNGPAGAARRSTLRVSSALILTVACWVTPSALAMAIAAAVVAMTATSAWRLPAALACLGASASLRMLSAG
ncbi:MAG: hypothetical protein H0W83_17085 [Planctomycetes bacterium]|nr:hypothetical protein [Planctomycetota bacterium]